MGGGVDESFSRHDSRLASGFTILWIPDQTNDRLKLQASHSRGAETAVIIPVARSTISSLSSVDLPHGVKKLGHSTEPAALIMWTTRESSYSPLGTVVQFPRRG